MIIYAIDNDKIAKECRMLMKMNADCERIIISKILTDVPKDVVDSLKIVKAFAEEKIDEFCLDNKGIYTVDEKEEMIIFDELNKQPLLKQTLGSGVIMKSELDCIEEHLPVTELPVFKKVISSRCNLILVFDY